MDSLKLLDVRIRGDPPSRFDMVITRVTFKVAVVLLRSVTSHPIIPLMSSEDGKVAVKGHAITVGAVDPVASQVWIKEIETEKL
jgi:hypothetical protein